MHSLLPAPPAGIPGVKLRCSTSAIYKLRRVTVTGCVYYSDTLSLLARVHVASAGLLQVFAVFVLRAFELLRQNQHALLDPPAARLGTPHPVCPPGHRTVCALLCHRISSLLYSLPVRNVLPLLFVTGAGTSRTLADLTFLPLDRLRAWHASKLRLQLDHP